MTFLPPAPRASHRWHGVLALTLLLALGGCDGFGAIGNKQDYATKQAPLAYKSQGTATVLAFDERPYILSGSHNPDFVGLQLNNYGIPFSVKTKSGRPFAAEMTDAFARSLATGGIAARSIRLPGDEGDDHDENEADDDKDKNKDKDDEDSDTRITLAQAQAMLLKGRPRRALLVRVKQWESSTYKYTTLEFDLTAIVYDAAGKALASKHIKGSDELGGKILGAARKAREVSAAALPLKIDEILNSPEIRAAFMS
ncbi:MAG: hypothetical protein JWR16_1601 [Nevskia sp.]|nr:hypothetical protein [Nevskia sp.]